MINIYTILVNNDNELIVSVRERIMERSKLVDSFHFLVPQMYKDMDMTDFLVVMEYKLPVSQAYKTELLSLSEELYKEHLEYKLPFDTSLTKEPGDIQVQLTFTKTDMNEEGEIVQHVRHTTTTIITITPIEAWSDMIPDESLTSLAQALLKVDSQIKNLQDTVNIVDNSTPDNLAYEDGYLQLTRRGEGIGDKVNISNSSASENIRVVEF